MVAEQTAGQDGTDRDRERDVERIGHRDCEGHHDGKRTPRAAGRERNERAEQEDDGRNQHRRELDALHRVNDEAGRTQTADHAAQRPCQNQGDGDIGHALHAVNIDFKGLLEVHDFEQLDECHQDDRTKEITHCQRNTEVVAADLFEGEALRCQRDEQGCEDDHDGQDHHDGLCVFLGVFAAFGRLFCDSILKGIFLCGGLFLGLLHQGKILLGEGYQRNEQNREDGVELERDGLHKSRVVRIRNAEVVELGLNKAHDVDAPADERDENGDRRGRRVQDPRQLLPGNFQLVEERTEHRADQQRRAEVGEEDQDAAQPCAELCLELGVDDFVDALAERLRTAGLLYQLDEAADEDDQDDDACVVGVGQLDEKVVADHRVDCRKRIAAAEDQCAGQSAEEQREDDILARNGKHHRHDGRQQAQNAIIHF